MRSIAIWYNTTNGQDIIDKNEADIHFNYWKLPSKSILNRYIFTNDYLNEKFHSNGHFRFLDIGVKFKYFKDIESINLYLPFDLKDGDCKDLGRKLLTDKDLLSAVFNQNLNVSSQVSKTISAITGEESKTFYIYELGATNFTIKPCRGYRGAHLEISIKDVSDVPEDNDLYIRFRIYSKGLKEFSYIEKLSNSFLQSAFSKVELVDFRLNDIRDIHPKLLEGFIEEKRFFNLRMVHFFFMGASSEENIYSNIEAKNCRLLEQYRWDNYIGRINYNSNKKILAYHWSRKAERRSENTNSTIGINYKHFNDFNLLFKTIYQDISWFEVLKYITVLIGIGVIINYISSILIENKLLSELWRFITSNFLVLVGALSIFSIFVLLIWKVILGIFEKRNKTMI